MIVHLDSDNPKPIEQKVQELILKKLYIKVDDEKIFINKEDFIALILRDVIAIAKANLDIDKALKIALAEQKEYTNIPETKRNELEETAGEFAVEIEAYQEYLQALEDDSSDDDIYFQVLITANSDFDFLEKKLHDLMIDSLGTDLSEEDAKSMGTDKWSMLDVFANQVKLIASNETIEEAVEEAYSEYENYPNKHLVKKESIKKEFLRFAPLAKKEISAYQMALSMESQNAEYAMILATVKQLLNLED